MPNIGKSTNESIQDRLRDEEEAQLQDDVYADKPVVVTEEGMSQLSDKTIEKLLEENPLPVVKAPTQQELVKAAEKVTRNRKQAPKTVAPQNLVEMYKEKIALVEHVQHVEMALAVSIDTEVISSKGGRDIIINLQKEIEEAKNKALLAIQSL